METQNLSHDLENCLNHHSMQNLYKMRLNHLLCDGAILLENGAELKVHRPILCACSDYFNAAFNSIFSGTPTNIQISGITSYAMTKIIDFAYLRTCELNETNVYETLVIADYLALRGLMDYCIQFLIEHLRPENCINIMRFAFARGLKKDLYASAKLYVLRNFEEVVAKSDELLDITIDEIYDIMNSDLLNIKDESLAWKGILRWIDFDPHQRIKHVPVLLSTIRLGILDFQYFMENVKDHKYVRCNVDASPIIHEVMNFLEDMNDITIRQYEITTPHIAMPRIPHDVIFLTGGWHFDHPVSTIQAYDTRADRWIDVPHEDPSGPRSFHGSAAVGFRVYVIGGFDGESCFNTCRFFDALNKTWHEISPMHSQRCYVSVVELNGFIYALGGFDGNNRLNSAERYDPLTNQWTLIPNMHFFRSDAHACTLNDKIYIIGGMTGQVCLSNGEYFDPQTNTWTLISDMSTRRSGLSCISFKGYLYAMGGFNGHVRLRSCERYDPGMNKWTDIIEMSYQRSNFATEILDDMIFVMGGYNGRTLSNNECFNVEKNEWLVATNLTCPRSGLKANVLKGLPNVSDYIYKNRKYLIEEQRLNNILNADDLKTE